MFSSLQQTTFHSGVFCALLLALDKFNLILPYHLEQTALNLIWQ